MVIRRLLRPEVICAAIGLFWLVQGVWAFAAPRAFFDALATFPPYNRHLIHDLGVLQIAVGAGALAAVLVKRALLVGLIGLSTFEVLHLVSHFIDRDLGGRPAVDLPGLAVVAVIAVVALTVARNEPPPSSAPPPPP